MKFCKRYREYMQGMEKAHMPVVSLKKLKKALKRCRMECHPMEEDGSDGQQHGASTSACGRSCHDHCPVCDETFFPTLHKEMSAVVGSFNDRARKLLDLHLASGFRKYLMLIKGKMHHNHGSLFDEGRELVAYAVANSVAMRKILKKYDKIHYSKQGQAFQMQAQTMHIEILHSPWFCELIAFYINLQRGQDKTETTQNFLSNCSLVFNGDKPSLSCGLFDSLKLNIDLTCSVCLDTVFDPVSLTCGHIFCYMCACGAASVSIVDGLKTASSKAKCPLCRRAGVYKGAVHLDELNILLSRNCHEYWEQRIESEREERVRKTKEYWDDQCRLFLGM